MINILILIHTGTITIHLKRIFLSFQKHVNKWNAKSNHAHTTKRWCVSLMADVKCMESPMTTLTLLQLFQGSPKLLITHKLAMMAGEVSKEKAKSGSHWTGRRWQDGLTCSRHVSNMLLGFHFPSEVIKNFEHQSGKCHKEQTPI